MFGNTPPLPDESVDSWVCANFTNGNLTGDFGQIVGCRKAGGIYTVVKKRRKTCGPCQLGESKKRARDAGAAPPPRQPPLQPTLHAGAEAGDTDSFVGGAREAAGAVAGLPAGAAGARCLRCKPACLARPSRLPPPPPPSNAAAFQRRRPPTLRPPTPPSNAAAAGAAGAAAGLAGLGQGAAGARCLHSSPTQDPLSLRRRRPPTLCPPTLRPPTLRPPTLCPTLARRSVFFSR